MAHLLGKSIVSHARTLAVALLFGTTVLSLAAGQAQAAKNSGSSDNGVRCAIEDDDANHIDFYLPGEKVASASGRYLECMDDGTWDDGGPIQRNRENRIPRTRGGGVFTTVP